MIPEVERRTNNNYKKDIHERYASEGNVYVCEQCYRRSYVDKNLSVVTCPDCAGRAVPIVQPESVQKKPESAQKKFVCRNCGSEKLKDEDIISTHCGECGSEMLEEGQFEDILQSRGGRVSSEQRSQKYVYVLVSSEKPNLVKVGMTERTPEERARELSQTTGVAMPYIVAYEAKTSRPKEVEKAVHRRLADKRVNPNREFFRVKPKRAIEAIEQEI
jgi:DNA-directed RNA polymerase subunit RPC12/RpoP